MSDMPLTYYLRVQQIEQSCFFELSWGEQGQQLNRILSIPPNLFTFYKDWQNAYFNFYRTLKASPVPEDDPQTLLRAKVVSQGVVEKAPVDWQGQLVDAEARLLYEFHRWLRDAELFDIRAKIAEASHHAQAIGDSPVELFLMCSPLDLDRLPWETWEIGAEFAAASKVRIVRIPDNLLQPPVIRPSQRRSARILAIVGTDPHLSFDGEIQTIQRLEQVADPHFVYWKPPKQTIAQFKTEIATAIADPQGWDALLFIVHSEETSLPGGELGIAPNASIRIHEIKAELAQAKANGLQFALFNSCKGLQIAESLVELGLSQVVIMREPIHHQVAQEFLIQFLDGLANYKDVHEALIEACQFLELQKKFTYPSVHIVPSLFCHPKADLFQIHKVRWRDRLRKVLPTRYEAIALAVMLVLGSLLPVQLRLQSQRVWIQAIYRNATQQIPDQKPPLLLVQVDQESIMDPEIDATSEFFDRAYLARLVNQAASMPNPIVGIDYIFYVYQVGKDSVLAEALSNAAEKDKHIILATGKSSNGNWLKPIPEFIEAGRAWQGDAALLEDAQKMTLLRHNENPMPFAYLLTLAYQMQDLPESQTILTASEPPRDYPLGDRFYASWLTRLSYRFRQVWLYPLVDFSIPPDRIYAQVSAKDFLSEDFDAQSVDPSQIIVIAPGGVEGEGITENEDNFPLSPALRYWRNQQIPPNTLDVMPGVEGHAYLFHHFQTQRLVIPIPDVWMILTAALIGKGIVLLVVTQSPSRRLIGFTVLGGSVFYAILSLQVYVSAGLLFPIVLPTAMLWFYIAPSLLSSKSML